MSKRRMLALVLGALMLAGTAIVAGLVATSGGSRSTTPQVRVKLNPHLPTAFGTGKLGERLARHGREAGRENGEEGNGGELGEENEILDGPSQEAYENRAFPFATIAVSRTVTARAAAQRVNGRSGPRVGNGWRELGPFILDVDRLATQTFNRPTQWSGRVTALALDRRHCGARRCAMFVAAAGGGIWRTPDALARTPHWRFVSADVPSTSLGSLLVDPSDRSGKTVYAGTGEESGSSDSEAGVGLYKSTNGGRNWKLVPASLPISKDRAIGAITVDPGDRKHIFIGTAVARHGASSVNGGRFTPPGAPPVGLYESNDGGATFHPSVIRDQDAVDPTSRSGNDFFRGGATKIGYDPNDSETVYMSMISYGLFRSQDDGASWKRIYTSQDPDNVFGIRYEFATADRGSKTRIYLADGRDEVFDDDTGEMIDASRLFRADDAGRPAATLTNEAAGTNDGWISISSPDKSDPGFGSFDFCEAQCSYDMWVESPPGQPGVVWLGGSMHYEELSLYAGADFSDGRAVVRSADAGVHWTDMTGDARTDFEDQHPDTRDLVFAPRNPAIAFVGSDGGLIRTSGRFSNVSSQCDDRDLDGQDLANCRQFLSAVPKRLIPVNAGLRTLQFESVSVNPRNPLNDLLGGTQDNATQAFTGSRTWRAIVTGDGGASGIDVGDPKLRYHTYFGPQGDVNYHGNNPRTWDWYMDPLIFSGEAASFYVPFQADPKVSQTAFVGLEHVWRTQTGGGDHEFIENHCFTNGGPKGDAIFTGPNSGCGDWLMLGRDSLTGDGYGETRGGDYVVQDVRAPSDTGTLWAATRGGRVFVSKNADASGETEEVEAPPFCVDEDGNEVSCGTLTVETDVTFKRIDDGESADPVTPERFVSGIAVDAKDPNHAIVSYSGYDAYATAAGTPTGHVFDVRYNRAKGSATWRNLSYDLGDQPITGVQLDSATGDIYASTDFGVNRLVSGTRSWIPAAGNLPPVAVYGITLVDGARPGRRTDRALYAATHGRGVWRLMLPAKGKY